jgi:hypothetical protein
MRFVLNGGQSSAVAGTQASFFSSQGTKFFLTVVVLREVPPHWFNQSCRGTLIVQAVRSILETSV